MKARILFIFMMAVTVLLATSCQKGSTPPITYLQFAIIDDYGNPASGAVVYLYNSEYDYAHDVNLLKSVTADHNGVASFSYLNAQNYYYYISRSSDCSSNYFTTYKTAAPLVSGQVNSVSVLINATGTINLNNYSADPYKVSIDGNYWGTVDGKSTDVVTVKPGTYMVHVVQASGYASSPTIEDFKANISTCDVGDVDFP